jgi:hypothetical protein
VTKCVTKLLRVVTKRADKQGMKENVLECPFGHIGDTALRNNLLPTDVPSAREFSAMHAMAISGAVYRSCDLVRNASAEATRLHDG